MKCRHQYRNTDITRQAIHSHNDYWRAKPFWTALSNGVVSVEADVWLYNGTLYVRTPVTMGMTIAWLEPLLTLRRLAMRSLHSHTLAHSILSTFSPFSLSSRSRTQALPL